jgi:hypothetical protein
MERFFESLFPFLVVAAFVGVRIVFMLRRRRAGRQENEGAPPKRARGFVPWENEFRDDSAAGNAGPVQNLSAGGDEGFSAWNLSVDDPPAAAAPPRLPEAPLPLTASPARFGAMPERAAQPRRQAPVRRREERFRGLPPLQQAVVWAEILGAPKGLQD